jgi:dienelactone hydrolase
MCEPQATHVRYRFTAARERASLPRMTDKPRGPIGNLSSYRRDRFSDGGIAHDIYRKGSGPAVIVITEMPGITPRVLGFADRVAAIGCSVILPSLFGTPGREPYTSPTNARLYSLRSALGACISRDFSMFALHKSSPVIEWLRALARQEHARCGGPGVGAVGMCFTGGFALAMATEPRILAPVLSQPSLPMPFKKALRESIDCSPSELAVVKQRCQNEGLRVLGLRFQRDPLSPGERFQYLKQQLGDGFVAVELDPASRHPAGFLPAPHSVLTEDLVDAPGEPTRAALDQVLELFRSKLLVTA